LTIAPHVMGQRTWHVFLARWRVCERLWPAV